MLFRVKKLSPEAIIPKYANPTDAGMDIFSLESVTLQPGERKNIKTGIAFALPTNHVGLVWDKSSVPSKFGVHCMAGVIDESYRGELQVVMINLGQAPHTFEKGQKIAQLLVQPITYSTIQEVQELDETARGRGGFGSTGTH